MPDPKKPRGTALPEISDVASMGECTGLMPTPPLDTGELESYQQLYSTSLPADEDEDKGD